MAIITYPLNDIEYAACDAETYLSTRTSGIYSAEGQFVATVTGTRKITITGGLAWIRNGDFKGKSVAVTVPEVVNVVGADSVLPRIDVLALRFDALQNATSFVMIQGVPNSSPVTPALTRNPDIYELGLYLVNIPAASAEVLDSHLTSVKLDENYCGLMRDGVTGIPTQDLQNAFNVFLQTTQEEFEQFLQDSQYEYNTFMQDSNTEFSNFIDNSDQEFTLLYQRLEQEYAEAGELAEEYMPHIGDNGYWYIGTLNTGVLAKGDKGDKGDTGKAGQNGHTPERGTDYWTQNDKNEIITETTNAVLAQFIDATVVAL